jgi:hypothetical protein
MSVESIEHRREEAESCVEEFHVQKFWINTKRVLIQTHGVQIFSVYVLLNVMLMNVLLFLSCNCCLCYVCMISC